MSNRIRDGHRSANALADNDVGQFTASALRTTPGLRNQKGGELPWLGVRRALGIAEALYNCNPIYNDLMLEERES
jgi:hypothetical protein